MLGYLGTKSKVISTVRPKSQIFRRKIKRERASTPQRWSRRIRSLPPVPINVLSTHRKNRQNSKKSSFSKREKHSASKFMDKASDPKSSYRLLGGRKNIFINKNISNGQSNSVEVVRIVPVVVYVKKSNKANCRTAPGDVQVQISGKLLKQAFNNFLGRKIKKERPEKRYSRRLRMLPPNN